MEVGGQAVITNGGIHLLEKLFHTYFTAIDHCLLQGINESLSLQLKEKNTIPNPKALYVFSALWWQQKSVSQLAYDPVGTLNFSFSIMENGTFLLHSRDIFHCCLHVMDSITSDAVRLKSFLIGSAWI